MGHLPGVGAPAQGAARIAARSPARSGSRFAERLREADEASEEAQARPAGQVAGPSAVFLSLQDEAPQPDQTEERDTRARRVAEATLEDLAALQHGMLAGRVDQRGLDALARRLDTVQEAADPELAALVGQVVLRARVELARLEAMSRIRATAEKSP